MSPMSDSLVVSIADITGHRRLHQPILFFRNIMDYWKIVEESAEVETTGESEGRGDDRNNNIIPPSNVPDMLPTMSVQDIWSKEVTITPREVAPQIVVEKTDIERIEEGSDIIRSLRRKRKDRGWRWRT